MEKFFKGDLSVLIGLAFPRNATCYATPQAHFLTFGMKLFRTRLWLKTQKNALNMVFGKKVFRKIYKIFDCFPAETEEKSERIVLKVAASILCTFCKRVAINQRHTVTDG